MPVKNFLRKIAGLFLPYYIFLAVLTCTRWVFRLCNPCFCFWARACRILFPHTFFTHWQPYTFFAGLAPLAGAALLGSALGVFRGATRYLPPPNGLKVRFFIKSTRFLAKTAQFGIFIHLPLSVHAKMLFKCCFLPAPPPKAARAFFYRSTISVKKADTLPAVAVPATV